MTAIAILLVTLVASPVSVGGETLASPQLVELTDAEKWEAATEAIAALIKSKGALDSYTEAGEIVVVVPSSGTSSLGLADTAALGVSVRIERQDLEPEEVRQIIKVAKERWQPVSSQYAMAIGFDAKIGKVRIFSDAPSEVFEVLQEQFPGLVLHERRTIGLTRHKDFEPHWGGAQMVEPGSPLAYDCTSGFSVWNSNLNPRMVTAAHCFDLNTTVDSPSGSTFGTVKKRQSYPTNDFELVGGGGVDHGPAIYVDGNVHNPSPYRWVLGAGATGFNVEYCFSGATRYEVCTLYMIDDDYDFCYEAGCTTHTQMFQGEYPGAASCYGDSGAPFYRYVGTQYQSDVTIRGIAIASDCGPGGSDTITLIEKWPKIRDTYNVTIMTH